MSIRHLLHLFMWRARRRKSLGFMLVSAALVISLLGNALTFYLFDRSFNPGLTFGDCLWYSLISISTIGYGDLSAASAGARIGTIIFIIITGLAAFTAFFGIVLDWFIDLNTKERRGMCRVYEKNHILIVNFPSAQQVLLVIEELAREECNRDKVMVIISDRITELPFSHKNVAFIHGSPIERETYEQANIQEAREAIVLCTAPDDPASDSVVASIISVIEHINPALYTVAECLSDKHRFLFESTQCDSIICSTRIVNNLLVHESQDKGVVRFVDVITTHNVGETIFTLEVGETDQAGISCLDLAKKLLDSEINLLCVNRGKETHTDFKSLEIRNGDVLVYIAKQRTDWQTVKSLYGAKS